MALTKTRRKSALPVIFWTTCFTIAAFTNEVFLGMLSAVLIFIEIRELIR